MPYKYKMVRSYTSGNNKSGRDLNEAFDNGWEFVRASDLIKNHSDYCDYIEYILRKEVEEK